MHVHHRLIYSSSVEARYWRLCHLNSGKAVIFALEKNAQAYGERNVYSVGKDDKDYAHNLFDLLRKADKNEFDLILCEGITDEGYGLGVMNRLIKASAGNVIE